MKAIFETPNLTFRLVGLAALVMIIAGGFVLFGAYLYAQSAADRAYDQLLRGAALQISEGIYLQDGAPVVELPPSAFHLLGFSEGDHVFYNITAPDGTSLAGYPELHTDVESGQFLFSSGRFEGYDLRLIGYGHLLVEEGFIGQIGVIIGQTTEARQALTEGMIWRAFWVLGLLGVIVLLLLTISISLALNPLRDLEHELQARDPLDFSPLQTKVPREMQTFSGSMNQFLKRLKRRVDVMQRIVADSTHQIRTPIAAIRAQADLPVDYEDKKAVEENKKRIQKQARELSRLSEQLLTEAMVSHRADTVEMEAIDLRKVALEAEKNLHSSRLWPEGSLQLALSEEPCLVKGDLFSLREAVKNLATNALEYGAPPVVIAVGEKRISICDRGDGFAPDEIAQGHGRGLAIVRDVMEIHGGRLSFEKRADRFCAILDFGGER